MAYDLDNKLKIGVATRALFQLEKENEIFTTQGRDAYEQYQIEHEDKILQKGAAFSLIRALLNLNQYEKLSRKVEVLLISRNSMNTSLRVFNSIEKYQLGITRGVFTSGGEIGPYLEALDIDLFLTANEHDAREAINRQIPAARLFVENLPSYLQQEELSQIRIAFDGDAVLFSDESEAIYQEKGEKAFEENESHYANDPMKAGPFAKFLRLLSEMQTQLGDGDMSIRTALVTARSAPAHKRVVNTLRQWNVRIDEAFFLGGITKVEVLKAFGAHIFFDDQERHVKPASQVVPSGVVPYQSGSVMDQVK